MSVKKIYYKNNNYSNKDIEIQSIKSFLSKTESKLLEVPHRLDFWIFYYVTEGSIKFSIDFNEYNCKKGDLIVISKDKVFSLKINYNVDGYVFLFNENFFIKNSDNQDLDLIKFFETPINAPVLNINMSDKCTSRKLIDLLYKEAQNTSNNYKLLRSIFASFVYAVRLENEQDISKASIATYRNYYEYKTLIYKNYKKLKKVSDYENLLHLTKKTINKACRESAGVSAKKLISNRIILETKRLILQGDLKYYQIANELGYEEPANLASFFKTNTGYSMKKYKESITFVSKNDLL